MKKSKLYKMSQFAVLRDEYLSAHDKVEILRMLIKDEDLALWSEQKKEEKENAQ